MCELYFISVHVFTLRILALKDFDTKELKTSEKRIIKWLNGLYITKNKYAWVARLWKKILWLVFILSIWVII